MGGHAKRDHRRGFKHNHEHQDERDRAWPEEEAALKDIKEGRTKMIIVSAEEFIAELRALE